MPRTRALRAIASTIVLLVAGSASPHRVVGQALYTPRAVAHAFDQHTRSPDGRPGPAYWQNHARYAITVSASPPDRTIRGTERIEYFNASPDTLKSLVVKLLLNIHRPEAPREGATDPGYLNRGVTIDSVTVGGRAVPWQERPFRATWQVLQLPAPLLAHDSLALTVAWHYTIAEVAGREGVLDSTTYFLAYFYPRIAVYDDYNGWDRMNFTDAQEFYSDFNDYDVTVRVPANYVVWGTGTLTNAPEVLQPASLALLQASFASDSVIHVASREEMAGHRVTNARPINEWHFRAQWIPDMTFALSDHYVWDAASVTVDSTPRRVSIQAAFNDTAADFHHMVGFGQHAVGWLSRHWPGIPYPYEKSTIVQGSADMEYPMMVNDGSEADTGFSRFVAEHEIAHTYMPFYMGINETRYAFMDEGWATTFEYLIGENDIGRARADTFYREFRVADWIGDPSPLQDLPIITPEDAMAAGSWGNNAYGKASLGYLAAKDLLGDELFARCLHAYMDRWHGKHPIPWDFFATFNDVSHQDLNWFWRRWYFDNSYIDLGVTVVRPARGGYAIELRNRGGMPAPVDLQLTYGDGSTATLHQTPALWRQDAGRATVQVRTTKTLQSVRLDGGIWMDADPTDNAWSRPKH
ncbi:MAG: M1 family metallopeptidase [Gemmatimonadetes bacterium]|nr:M1 family metallopeptidase [Gemmatimonadota bacterium]